MFEAVGTLVIAGLIFAYFTGRLDGLIENFKRNGTPGNPQIEDVILDIYRTSELSYTGAANDIIQARVPTSRANDLCRALPNLMVQDWIGKVERVDLTNGGWGLIILSLNSHVTVQTPTLEALDFKHEMVPPNTALANSLETFKVGQYVYFSGRFTQSQQDCFLNTRLTESGRMSDPQLSFVFSNMRPVR